MYFESDLLLLQKLFFPNVKYVSLLDPEGSVKRNVETGFLKVADQDSVRKMSAIGESLLVINMTNIPVHHYPFQERAIEGIISFKSKGEFYGDLIRDTFYCVYNEIDTIRWVFPNNIRFPYFLRYYDADAEYGNLFRGFCNLAGMFRQMKWMADSHFYVLHQGELFFDNFGGEQYDSFTLFTKEHFYSGIGLLQLIKDDKISWFVKFADTEEGKRRIKHEHKILTALNEQEFSYFKIPESKEHDNFLMLSNCLNYRPKPFSKLKSHHFKAVGEYIRTYAKNARVESILKEKEVMLKWEYIGQKIKNEDVPKGLSTTNLARVYKTLTDTMNEFPLDKEITASLMHGDFTEENMTIEDNKLVLMDWEYAQFDSPVLGDFMNFLEFEIEQIAQPDLERFQGQWEKLLKQQPFQELCKEFANDFTLQFQLHLFLKALNYLYQNVDKIFLPYFINWRLYFWMNLLEAFREEQEWLQISKYIEE